jgi:hypothetical protein
MSINICFDSVEILKFNFFFSIKMKNPDIKVKRKEKESEKNEILRYDKALAVYFNGQNISMVLSLLGLTTSKMTFFSP